ncbi:30S ribosomal protein S2 [Candidatus Collierbacteria bacterium CG10_big_fil_rev_8_21_14_0_10_44_9]|uniref:Small ribosomal subunit protein uS2 n=1 Tax=Candidatus Collierbacteria bacterium CG10_big_fil_rev_8_21_14_0_10_44_9 TaxID=1974535 RepID=A0A2H0VLM9_9BACT|nr:MAG: 30S ribosomal protein S2 [Candidatus Collierbacteria bacterium CG10_big_fil_rev_8_21_14_0_10_44_9]
MATKAKEVSKKSIKLEVAKQEKAEFAKLPSLKEMLEAGVHFGHSIKRRNPRMDEYVYAVKNGVQIFDLVQTRAALNNACNYLVDVISQGGQILLVGTKAQAAETIKSEAERLGVGFITTHWVGGLFTNWEQIKTRVDKLIDMKKKYEAGEYKKYTKKEQVLLKREIDRLERMYGGLVTLKGLPKTVFIVDPTREITAMREASARDIKVVAIVDSNGDPTGIEKVIPANDDALKSVVMLVLAITSAIEKGQKLCK